MSTTGLGIDKCWFCGDAPGSPDYAVPVGFKKLRSVAPDGDNYEIKMVSIPRCEGCLNIQQSGLAFLGLIGPAVGVIAAYFAWQEEPILAFPALLLGAASLFTLRRQRRATLGR